MQHTPLFALTALDGRYRSKIETLAGYFSEAALIRYRIRVEIEYLVALCETNVIPDMEFSDAEKNWLRGLYEGFSQEDAEKVKFIENITNHDVKAVEYFIKEKITELGNANLLKMKEFVHFGLTSQDINNTATPLMLKEAIHEVYIPYLDSIIQSLADYAAEWRNLSMLAYTHGQPASPTTLGKEIAVFQIRLQKQRMELAALPYPAKFGGATGNMNAHYITYPKVNWHQFAGEFVGTYLKLERSFPTTQIEHYDGLARIFHCIQRINGVLTDLCVDMWLYISKEYFKQKTKAGEVGSSAMPHKVNPIDFENAEGNLGISTALFEFLSRKLPVSRLQRDLTDSTLLRNIGTSIGHSYLAMTSLSKGLSKLLINPAKIQADLDANWAVLAEAIQTILRRENYPNPYEALKDLTRGKEGITAEALYDFIGKLDVSTTVKAELLELRPENYVGNAREVW